MRLSLFFEALMVVSFGISWPISIWKSVTSKTTKGKSLIFMIFILIGYIFGIIAKLLADQMTYVFIFYVLNFLMVSCDILLYVRNKKYDMAKAKE